MEERRCLRCGAPYDEGATVCFTCGASIGELETPTQPVRAPRRPTADVAPTEPDAAVSRAEQSGQPAPAPVVTATEPAAPRPLTVGTSYQPVAPPPRPSRRVRWPLVIALLVVVAGLATGGVIALRAVLAPPPVPTTITYHDPEGRFSFAKPALWTVTPRTDGALLADSSGANTLTISVAAAGADQTASAVADTLAAHQGLQAAPAVSIAGDQWEQRTGSVIGSDGATRTLTLYVDIHAGAVYTIQTSSPSSVADSENTLVYQPLLASFTFH